MTKSTQQLADEMARKCAENVNDYQSSGWLRDEHTELDKGIILNSIPILELLEVARAAKRVNDIWSGTKEITALIDALTNLQKKVEL